MLPVAMIICLAEIWLPVEISTLPEPTQFSPPDERSYFVAFQQHVDATGQGFHDFRFSLHHLGEVDGQLVSCDAMIDHVVAGLDKQVARFQQGLAGNAADSQTGPSKLVMIVDDGRF